eukprot:2343231-Lingulodinium_polyedra.AAC.1
MHGAAGSLLWLVGQVPFRCHVGRVFIGRGEAVHGVEGATGVAGELACILQDRQQGFGNHGARDPGVALRGTPGHQHSLRIIGRGDQHGPSALHNHDLCSRLGLLEAVVTGVATPIDDALQRRL